MSGKRIVEETPCPSCDEWHVDRSRTGGNVGLLCWGSGGSRRTLTEGQYVLIEKEDGRFPEWAYAAMRRGGSHRGMLDQLSEGPR